MNEIDWYTEMLDKSHTEDEIRALVNKLKETVQRKEIELTLLYLLLKDYE
ncbi:MAG: hypothetical protein R3321_02140 [Nitrososphaeraceae archaeon]|nr:hypothetical protein [Nitrososphaeraceae archaeon]